MLRARGLVRRVLRKCLTKSGDVLVKVTFTITIVLHKLVRLKTDATLRLLRTRPRKFGPPCWVCTQSSNVAFRTSPRLPKEPEHFWVSPARVRTGLDTMVDAGIKMRYDI